MATPLDKGNHGDDPIFLILRLCEDANLKETAHMLEKESGYFFNLDYFEDLVINGKWEEVEKYLAGFIDVKDNKYSSEIYFSIRKQKYYEALSKNEHTLALDILRNDLRVFEESNRELYTQLLSSLVTIKNVGERTRTDLLGLEQVMVILRKPLVEELRRLIEKNPLLKGKTKFPQINTTTLNTLINLRSTIHDHDPSPLQLGIGPHLKDSKTKTRGPEIRREQNDTGSSSSFRVPYQGNKPKQ